MAKTLAQLNVIIGASIKGFEQELGKIEKKLNKFQRSVERTGQSLTTNLTLPIAALGGAAVKTAADMEVIEQSLITAMEGSADAAAAAFEEIKAFAAGTPFQLQEVTKAFIKLKNMGLDPSMEALASYGNTASAMGKSLNDMIEAVADAATGEFERLKEFGIKAKTEGDRVKFTFRGITTEVGKNAAEIEQYLQNIGNTDFAGGIERQAGTLSGLFSTLRDNVTVALSTLGQEISETFDLKGAVKNITESIGRVVEWFQSLDDEVKRNVIRMAAFAAAIGPALLIVGKLAGAVSTVVGTLKSMAGMTKTIASSLSALVSPVGLTVAAVAALAAAVTYVVYNWEALTERFSDINWWKNALISMVQFFLKNNPFSYIIEAYNYVSKKLGGEGIKNPFAEWAESMEQLKVPTAYKTQLKSIGETAQEVGRDLLKLVGLDFTPKASVAESQRYFDMMTAGFEDIERQAGETGDAIKVMQDKLNMAASIKIQMEEAGLADTPAYKKVILEYENLKKRLQKVNVEVEIPEVDMTPLRDLTTKLKAIDQEAATFGTSHDVLKDKVEAAAGALRKLIDEGQNTGPVFDAIKAKYTELNTELMKLQRTRDGWGDIQPIDPLPMKGVETKLETLKKAGDRISELREQLKSVQSIEAFTRINAEIKELEANMASLAEEAPGRMEKIKEVMIDIGAVVSDALAGTVAAFGSAMGQMLAGASSIGDAAKAMVMPLIGVLDQIGDLAIQTGIAMLAIKKVLNFGNPLAAIAAGVALKALASFVKAKIAGSVPKLAEGGLAYGPTIAMVGDNRNAAVDPEVISPLSKLKDMIMSTVQTAVQSRPADAVRSVVNMVPQQLDMLPALSGNMASSPPLDIQIGEMKLRGADLYAQMQLMERRNNRIY